MPKSHKVNIKPHPLTTKCCVVEAAALTNLKGGDSVTWSTAKASSDCRVVFPDSQVFGVDSFIIKKGSSSTQSVAQSVTHGLAQDYVIFCLDTSRKVKPGDGIEPTIIIGG
ncbi:hypothetical protein H8E52_07730 [bacterium]|nr:hypothetical protein [bacterium]